MKRLDLRYRDYIGLVGILVLMYYCFQLNTQVKSLEDKIAKLPFSSGERLEEGDYLSDFITLYFSDDNAEYLVGEERNIKGLSPEKAVRALIEGPRGKGLITALPIELEILQVVIEDEVAYVYIHESVPLVRHGIYGSSASTTHIINSISATLILHEPFGIKKVKIEGNIWDLLQGIDPEMLFDIDRKLIKAE